MKPLFAFLCCLLSAHLIAGTTGVDKSAEARTWLKNQPMQFVENKGQFTNSDGKPADNVLFKATTGDLDIYITTKGLSYVFYKQEEIQEEKTRTGFKDAMPERPEKESRKAYYYRMDMNLEGASIGKDQVIKELPASQGVTNYFYPHCPDGIYGVQQFGKITIKNIYKGIDWVIYTNASGSKGQPLKYDFVVQPQANYRDIKIKFVNAQSTTLTDNATKLKIKTIAGTIEEGGLYSYLGNNTDKQAVTSKYTIDKNNLVQFEVGEYDRTKSLVIDPLVWATYYGKAVSKDQLASICVDHQDNVYITGKTFSSNFPLQQSFGSYWQPTNAGYDYTDAVIIKFDNKGVLLWSTYYGGTYYDGSVEYSNNSICVDSKDNIYIVGISTSQDLPVQPMAGAYFQLNDDPWARKIFILKFNNQGVRQWATYFGGEGGENAASVKTDKEDNIYITGITRSDHFPTKELKGAYWQPEKESMGYDLFILKFSSRGECIWSTYYGGVDNECNTAYEWASEQVHAPSICIDSKNNVYIAGSTVSYTFPTLKSTCKFYQDKLNGWLDAFLIKFDMNGTRQWATYIGGGQGEIAYSICCDKLDNVYITGHTASIDFPTKYLADAYYKNVKEGVSDIFIMRINENGEMDWSTYYGGNDNETGLSICSDNLNNIYIGGNTYSSNMPTHFLEGEYWQPKPASQVDAFIMWFDGKGVRKWVTYYGGIQDDKAIATVSDSKNSVYFVADPLTQGAFLVDYGNGAYFDNQSFTDGILKYEFCNNQKPTSVQSNRNNLCILDNGNITLTAIGGTGDTLKWYTGACGLVNIGKGTSLTIPVPPKTTTYYARWESTCDTSACDSIVINVFSQFNTTNNSTICEGDTCKVGLSRYTTSGSYTDNITTGTGCDSIVTTNLVVNPLKRTTLKPVLCEGDYFIVGNHSYNRPGIYHDTLSTIQCDSIITTHLTVNPNAYNSQKFTICQGDNIKIGMHVYTATGTYADTLKTYLNCDSIINTTLIVNPTYNLISDKGICEGDVWIVGPHTYSSSGIYADTLSAINSCDSIITTHLTVHPKHQISISPKICSGGGFVIGKHTYTVEGTYRDTLQTIYNCDSIVTTNLQVNPVKSTPLIKSICEGEAFVVGNSTYTIGGLYTDHLSTYLGCDSIVTTNLTVNPLPVLNLGSDMIICPGDTINLTPGPGFSSYLWSDGSVLSHLLVTKPGDYSVIVRNEWCPASDEVYIGECGIELIFPNAFSPNNNATNERFMPVVIGSLKTYLISIYNKWGQLVYESANAAEGWDGTCNGQPCPIGLYVYTASYAAGIEPAVTHATVRGSVTLLR